MFSGFLLKIDDKKNEISKKVALFDNRRLTTGAVAMIARLIGAHE